jgi:autotransporter-associated beta strand protein
VGTGKAVNINLALGGDDAANYIFSSSGISGNYGQITQLASVSWVGSSTGGNWSNSANWAGGATPTLNNVAQAIIPTGISVNYDSALVGQIGSAIVNNGQIGFNGSDNFVLANAISGAGGISKTGPGVLTISGNNSFAGNLNINGSKVLLGSNGALGSGSVLSSGGYLGTTPGVILPALHVTGDIRLSTGIATLGNQTYRNALIVDPSSGVGATLSSANGSILFDDRVDSTVDKNKNLTVQALNGSITFADSIGSIARLNNLVASAQSIYILADILTASTQTYNGAVFIGDASYIGKAPSLGFLFTDRYKAYFQYVSGTGSRSSDISYLNSNPMYVRTLISEDPSISFNGAVNDTVANTHTILIAAIAPAAIPYSSGLSAVNGAASINFNAPVGTSAPLYSLNAQVVVNNSQADAASSYIGAVHVVDGVSTYSNQTYRANMMTAQSSSQPGGVTFSVWDPAASVGFNLPEQTVANSSCSANCGQMNLQNPGSVDILAINGLTNFALDANLTGVNNWGNQFVRGDALGYTPPPTVPMVRASYIPEVNGGVLRESLKFHADQVQYSVNEGSLVGSVTVGSPKDIDLDPSAKTTQNSTKKQLSNGSEACGVDEKSDMSCGK